MHVATSTSGYSKGGRATANIEMQSDGELERGDALSRDGSITGNGAGGEHDPGSLGRACSIQEACDAGLSAILERPGNGALAAGRIFSAPSAGLIGGGMPGGSREDGGLWRREISASTKL